MSDSHTIFVSSPAILEALVAERPLALPPIQRSADAMIHRFQLGQTVRLNKSQRYSSIAGGSYEVKRQLPYEDGDLHYRIRSALEQYDRVVKESELVGSAGIWEVVE
jgi:hypothetical protein